MVYPCIFWAERSNGMNFLRQPAKSPLSTPAASPTTAQPAFPWLELIVIPVAASIMETQPISLVLLLLGLQWWAMFVYYLVRQRGLSAEWVEVIHISGLCLAFALALVTHLQLLQNIATLVVAAGLIVWFWRRGMKLARLERSDEYLI